MSKRPDTWMPFFVGDYLADTMHLTRDQHGGYLLLIFAYWRKGAPLEDNDAALSVIARATPAEWRRLRPVLAPFFAIGAGVWRHKRIDQEIERAASRTSERSKSGAAGAAKRWQNGSKSMAEPIAGPSVRHRQNNASPQPEEGSVGSDEPTGAVTPTHDPEKPVYDLGYLVLGKGSGGLVTKLLQHHGRDCVKAIEVLDRCRRKSSPKEFLVGHLRGAASARAEDAIDETDRMYRQMGVQ